MMPQKHQQFINLRVDEKLDYDAQKSNIETNDNIRQAKEVSKVQTDDNIRQAKEVAALQPKVNSDGSVKGVSSTLLTQIYKSRSDEINSHFEAGYDKEEAKRIAR